MKICTFNVNSIRARRDLLLQWLQKREMDIDVLMFQELKVVNDFFPYREFEELGYSCEVFGQKAYNGVAICSTKPISQVKKGFKHTEWDEQKRIISVETEGIHIINVYAPHGDLPGMPKFDYKQGWYRIFMEYLSANFQPTDALIIGGDLNITREDLDVFSPEALKGAVGTLPEERILLQELLSWGLTDSFRFKHPEMRQFTWWDYKTAGIWRDEGMRIDYFLVTDPVLSRIENIEVDLWPRRRKVPIPSDHAPIIITLSG